MPPVLITSGPTREYLDPVRYLTNASSGRMGSALAAAALKAGHEVIVVSGPVAVEYPSACRIVSVTTTAELLEQAQRWFAACSGVIGAAAPCDYRPVQFQHEKIAKTGEPLQLNLEETPDVLAALGADKRPGQWIVGFALETTNRRQRAMAKLEKKRCDLMVLNGPEAVDSPQNRVEILDRAGSVVGEFDGSKQLVAEGLFRLIAERFPS